MGSLQKTKEKFFKLGKVIEISFDSFFDVLIKSYGWRGFLFRIIVIVVSFGLVSLDEATHGGPAGVKIWLVTCALLVYSFGKLIYDYSKFGKESEAKKHNK